MEPTAVLFDIGRYRNADGPGIRTILFFKGCPLRCRWCSNPFGLSPQRQMSVNFERCTGCGVCEAVCPNGVNHLSLGEKVQVDFAACSRCGQCISRCPAKARTLLGKVYTPRQLYEEAAKDEKFYRRSFGGVTFSGGEVLLQHEAAAEALRLCQENYMDTCLETSGYGPWEPLENVARFCDTIFMDLKHIDSARHKALTGVPNESILDNIRRLCVFSGKQGIRMILRYPVIPGCNDGAADLEGAASFAEHLPRHLELNLLPYHNLGESKYAMIGREVPISGQASQSVDGPSSLRARTLFAQYAPHCPISVGGDAIEQAQDKPKHTK